MNPRAGDARVKAVEGRRDDFESGLVDRAWRWSLFTASSGLSIPTLPA